ESNLLAAFINGGKEPSDRVRFIRAHLEGAELVGADLEMVDLRDTHLERADLTQAHLEGAYLDRARLEGANLSRAHLERTRLNGAHLEGANLHKTQLNGADLRLAFFDSATSLSEVILTIDGSDTVQVADAHWSGVNLAVTEWGSLTKGG